MGRQRRGKFCRRLCRCVCGRPWSIRRIRTAIAHSIREQVDVYVRSLALHGYRFDGADVLDEELRSVLLAPFSKIVRATSRWTIIPEVDATKRVGDPTVGEGTRARSTKEAQANTRGRRGVNLPDREPQNDAQDPG